jgi:hypothetical protein
VSGWLHPRASVDVVVNIKETVPAGNRNEVAEILTIFFIPFSVVSLGLHANVGNIFFFHNKVCS